MFLPITPQFLYDTPEKSGGGAEPDPAQVIETPEQNSEEESYKKRYGDLQSHSTSLRKERDEALERAQAYEAVVEALRGDDDDLREQALEALGLSFEDEDGEEETEEQAQYAQLDPQTQQLISALVEGQVESYNAQVEQQEEQQLLEEVTQLCSVLDPVLVEMNIEDEELRNQIMYVAIGGDWIETPEGPMPDLQGAIDQIVAAGTTASKLPQFRKQFLEDYRASKDAPFIAADGAPAGEQLTELLDDRKRKAHMQSLLENT